MRAHASTSHGSAPWRRWSAGGGAMLYLYLFGHLSVANGDGAVATAEVELAGRPGSLLAYLALARGRFFARGELLSALWPDQSEGGSIRCLNTVLWRLRKALAKPPLSRPLEQLDSAHVDQLRRGVALYRNDILAGFTDDWALRARELHRR